MSQTPAATAAVGHIALSTSTHYVFLLENTVIQLKLSDLTVVQSPHGDFYFPTRFYLCAVRTFLLAVLTPPARQDSQ